MLLLIKREYGVNRNNSLIFKIFHTFISIVLGKAAEKFVTNTTVIFINLLGVKEHEALLSSLFKLKIRKREKVKNMVPSYFPLLQSIKLSEKSTASEINVMNCF